MTKDQKTLEIVKEIITEMFDQIDGKHFVVDLSYQVEELVSILDLDTTFNKYEIKDLKRAKYKLSKNNQTATKTYKGFAVSVIKEGISDYELSFGKGGKSTYENTNEISDIINSDSMFFQEIYEDYKDLMRK